MNSEQPIGLTDPDLRVAVIEDEINKAESERKAALEQKAYDTDTLTPTPEQDDHEDRRLAYWLRFWFFIFALAVNGWWDHHVAQMVWQAGRVNAGFHLSDRVLMTLLTTSIANFLGLLTIIAHYLFGATTPSLRRSAKSKKAEALASPKM